MAKTKTTPSSAAKPSLVLDPRAQLEAMPGLREVLERLGLFGDLEAALDRCVAPLFGSPHPDRQLRAAGVYFSAAEVERFLRFTAKLRHIKGKWAGRPLTLDLWQVLYVAAPVFGWRQADGNRFHRELWLEVPRKNGKSTICSAIALYLLTADSNLKAGRLAEPGAEVYSAAATTRQAKEVFRPAEQMARRSPALARRLAIKTDQALIYERNASRYEVVSGVPANAEEKMGFNVSGAVIDEIHVHKDRALIDTIESGTPAREQPLIAYITTAGLDADGTIYAEKHDFAVSVATGEVTRSRTWAAIYTIGEADVERWDQPEVWAKANPGLGVSVGIDYLEDIVSKARHSEPKRLSFLRLHLNVRTSSLSRWLSLVDWDRSGAFVVPADLFAPPGRVAYAGLDLANSTDLAVLSLLLPRWVVDPDDKDHEIEVLDVVLRAWTPADRIGERDARRKALLTEWVRKKLVIASPGNVIDYDDIEDMAFALADELDIRRLHFDRWGSKQIVQHLKDGGLSVFEMGQGFASFSPAMKETERLVLERRIRHGGHPLLRHAVGSLVVVQDAAGNVKPDRSKSTGFIDPWVATVMGVDAWSRDGAGGESVYEDRGLEVV